MLNICRAARSRAGGAPLLALLLAATIAITTATAGAADPPDAAGLYPQAELEALVGKDVHVATVAYRLQTAALPYCARHQRLSGLIVQDASQYRADFRPAMAATFGLRDLPTVVGVVPGSPADRAGIRRGDGIVAANGRPLIGEADGALRTRADDRRYARLVIALDRLFAAGPVTLAIRRDGATLPITLEGADACASDVQVDLSKRYNASADGQIVTISQALVDFVPSDDELAFVIAHELSHDILGHRSFLDATDTRRRSPFSGFGSNGSRLRATERQADYLALYLVAWAGYDVHGAARFWQRMARVDPLWQLLPDGSHPGIGTRLEALSDEAERIDKARATGQRLWPSEAELQPLR